MPGPTELPQARIESRELHRLYWQVLEGFRRQAAALVVLGGLAGVCEFAGLLVIAPILGLDSGAGGAGAVGPLAGWFAAGGPLGSPWLQSSLLVAMGVASGCIRWFSTRRFVKLRFDLEKAMRTDMLDRLFSMQWDGFHGLTGGAINNAFLTSIWHTGEGIQSYLSGAAAGLVVIVLFGTAAVLSPGLTVVVVGFGLAVAGISQIIARRTGATMRRAVERSEEIAVLSQQVAGNMKYIRVAGLQSWARSVLGQTFESYRVALTQRTNFGELQRLGVDVAGIAAVGLLLLAFRTGSGLPVGTFVAYMGLFYRMLPRMQLLQSSHFTAQAQASWLQWWTQMQARLRAAPGAADYLGGAAPVPAHAPEIAFDRVGFAYAGGAGEPAAGTGPAVLRDLSFVLPSGSILALVGESGAGKTTVMDLLLGLVAPQAGAVLVDGQPLSSFHLDDWRRCVGYLPQEPLLFAGSVLDNVAFADPAPDREKATACLGLAHAMDFVDDLEGGLDAPVGERGGRLSGGQRQRLALARALYRDPKVLLLDEPTSALDEENVARFRGVLADLRGRVTIVLISHQTDVVELADHVLRLPSRRPASGRAGATVVPTPTPTPTPAPGAAPWRATRTETPPVRGVPR